MYHKTIHWISTWAIFAFALTSPNSHAIELSLLAQPKAWSGVSEIVGYRQKVWFVNSEKFRNHNSADIYSYDLRTKRTRYVRSLFSQDAGDPVVANGLLYWPYEDSRFSASRGEFMVTNGRDWVVNMLPQGQAFHVHSLIEYNNTLYAAPSAWRAGIQTSLDQGLSWQILYDHQTPKRRVSRITSLAIHKGTLYAGLTANYASGNRLLMFKDKQPLVIKNWPQGKSVRNLVSFGDWLYAVHRDGRKIGVWRTNASTAEQVKSLSGMRVQDFTVAHKRLWVLVTNKNKGTLLSSANGLDWMQEYRFENSSPIDLASYLDHIFVGTLNPKGGGQLWGEIDVLPKQILRSMKSPTSKIPQPIRDLKVSKLQQALDKLDKAIQNKASYRSGISMVRDLIHPLAYRGGEQAGTELSKRLQLDLPDTQLSLIGGNAHPSAQEATRWYLLRAIGFIGKGHVPAQWLTLPWDRPANPAEKYFHPTPAAAWTVAQLGQKDHATLQALVQRLGALGDPKWLKSDIVSALTILTGQSFEFDIRAWQQWWKNSQQDFR